MATYNQNKQEYTYYACSIYTLLNIMKYNFGITVYDNFIIKACKYFESLGVWNPKSGAVFNIIYKTFLNSLNSKLGLKFRLVEGDIKTLSSSDTNCWGIGAIKYHNWEQLVADGVFSKEDVDQFNKYDGKTFGHNLAFDGSKGGYLINTNGTTPIKCSIETLRYMVDTGILRSKIRTIAPADEKTIMICELTKGMAKTDNMKLFLDTNKNNEYLKKAIELFTFGKQ